MVQLQFDERTVNSVRYTRGVLFTADPERNDSSNEESGPQSMRLRVRRANSGSTLAIALDLRTNDLTQMSAGLLHNYAEKVLSGSAVFWRNIDR